MKFAHPEHGQSSIFNRDIAGNNVNHTVQTVTTVLPGEAIQAGSVSVGGYIYLENLGTSVLKIVEKDTLKSFAKLLPSQPVLFRTGDDFLTTYRIVANRSECDVLIIWFDE
jgi:predicted membrane-bound spermidine synthase